MYTSSQTSYAMLVSAASRLWFVLLLRDHAVATIARTDPQAMATVTNDARLPKREDSPTSQDQVVDTSLSLFTGESSAVTTIPTAVTASHLQPQQQQDWISATSSWNFFAPGGEHCPWLTRWDGTFCDSHGPRDLRYRRQYHLTCAHLGIDNEPLQPVKTQRVVADCPEHTRCVPLVKRSRSSGRTARHPLAVRPRVRCVSDEEEEKLSMDRLQHWMHRGVEQAESSGTKRPRPAASEAAGDRVEDSLGDRPTARARLEQDTGVATTAADVRREWGTALVLDLGQGPAMETEVTIHDLTGSGRGTRA